MNEPRRLPLALAMSVLGGAAAVALLVAGAAGGAVGPVAAADASAMGDGGVAATVKITFQTVPPIDRVVVAWGGKRLGLIRGQRRPLIVERPRDSGPLDIVLRAEGYLPVHTRVYTFNDNKVYVRMTAATDRKTLLGYRQELPDGGPADGGGAAAAPDGGRAPDAGMPLPVPR